ncbi:hypothetical protein ACIGBH_40555 [Streptomyces sp. NPDC085929]|uniref:hypothetical protein n=1 Tax=Streptomyces sp. NPDC085929 TaxID=3365739 RepID=UPI0037CF2867
MHTGNLPAVADNAFASDSGTSLLTLAVLLAARRELSRQAPAAEDEPRWGAGPAETASASLAVALAAYRPGTCTRVLTSGQVTAGRTPTATRQVTVALNTRPAPAVPATPPLGLGAVGSGTAGRASTHDR